MPAFLADSLHRFHTLRMLGERAGNGFSTASGVLKVDPATSLRSYAGSVLEDLETSRAASLNDVFPTRVFKADEGTITAFRSALSLLPKRDKEAMQDIIRQMQDWQPALIRAAIDGDDMKMARLLEERADPDYVEPLERKTLLHFASEYGQAQTALMLRYGNLQVARTLLDHGADPEAQSHWSWSNCGIRSLLHWTVVGGDFLGHHGKVRHRAELLRLLLDRGVDVNARCCMIHTPLQAAVTAVEDEEDPIAVIQLLLEKGAVLDVCDRQSHTPLYNAAGKSYRVVQILLNFGASADGMNPLVVSRQTPLMEAICSGSDATVRTLIEHKADFNVKFEGCTCLHYAACYNGRVVVDMLIDAGADTNATLVTTDDRRLKVAKLRLGAILDKRVSLGGSG